MVCSREKRSKPLAKARRTPRPRTATPPNLKRGLLCTMRRPPFQLPSKSSNPFSHHAFLRLRAANTRPDPHTAKLVAARSVAPIARDGLAGDGIQAWHRLGIHPWVHHGAPHAAGGTSTQCSLESLNNAADGDDRAALGVVRLHIASARLWERACQRKRAEASCEWRESARRIDLSYRAYRARLGECPFLRLRRPTGARHSCPGRCNEASGMCYHC